MVLLIFKNLLMFLADVEMNLDSNMGGKIPVLQTATALAISFFICKTAYYLTNLLKIEGGILPGITATVVILATLFPKQFGNLAPAGDMLALVLMQVLSVWIFPLLIDLFQQYAIVT